MNATFYVVAFTLLFVLFIMIPLLRKANNSLLASRRNKAPRSLSTGFSQPGLTNSQHERGPLISGPLQVYALNSGHVTSAIPGDVLPNGSTRMGSSPRIILGSDYLQNGRLSQLQSFREGREGENLIVQQICSCLDSRWTIFHNLDLPDKDGDIDVVLVGPGGIYAVEVKAYSGNLRVENGRYYKETSAGHMAKMQRGPGAQARKNASRLCNHLKVQGILRNNFVAPVVALAKDIPIELVSSATVIWTQDVIERRVHELNSRVYMSPEQAERIVRVLESIRPTMHGTVH